MKKMQIFKMISIMEEIEREKNEFYCTNGDGVRGYFWD